jgi:hypothetical protein
MKKQLIPALLAAMFATSGMGVYAADAPKPATDTSVPVKAGGEATANEPGRANDPGSAEKKQTGTKKTIKSAGAHPGGTAGCPPGVAAKGAGGDVKCEPEKAAKKPGTQ